MTSNKKPMSPEARAIRSRIIESNRKKKVRRAMLADPGRYMPGMPSKLFYATRQWRSIRYDVIRENQKRWPDGKARCEDCGAKAGDVVIQVDHIKPRSKYPHLELVKSNLRVTCESCNQGKGAKTE